MTNQEKKAWARFYLQKQAQETGCLHCGTKDNLTFHHVHPETKIKSIGSLVASRASIQTIQEEINKCIVLCDKCHQELHQNCSLEYRVKFELKCKWNLFKLNKFPRILLGVQKLVNSVTI